MCIYVRGSCLDKYISVTLGPLKQKFLAPPLAAGFPLFKQDMFNLRQSTPLKPLKGMACCPTPWLAGYFLQ